MKREYLAPCQYLKAKADYILGLASLVTAARTYGINYSVLERKCRSEKWREQRQAFVLNDDRMTLSAQIRRLSGLMDATDDPQSLDQLARAQAKLYATLWRLTGTPKEPVARIKRQEDGAKAAMLAKLAGKSPDKSRAKAAGSPAVRGSDYWSDY